MTLNYILLFPIWESPICWKWNTDNHSSRINIGTQLGSFCSFVSLLFLLSLCTVMSQAEEWFSPPGFKVWVLHTRRIINHTHEIGFCNRTGVEDRLAVTFSRLVCFFSEEHLSGDWGVLLCLWLFPSWFRPGHPRRGVIVIYLKTFQEPVFRLCSQEDKEWNHPIEILLEKPYGHCPGDPLTEFYFLEKILSGRVQHPHDLPLQKVHVLSEQNRLIEAQMNTNRKGSVNWGGRRF